MPQLEHFLGCKAREFCGKIPIWLTIKAEGTANRF
jgi:hypothetical protein